MPNLNDFLKTEAKVAAKGGRKATRKSTISRRRYDVIGHRANSEDVIHRNVSATRANELRELLRLNGCYAVDKIEVMSFVEVADGSKKLLKFSEKNYVPAHEGKAPGNATVSETKRAQDRLNMRQRNAQIVARTNKSTETRTDSDKVIVYDKMSGKAIFYGTELEAVVWMRNNKIELVNVVIYMPSKTLAKVVAKNE